MLTTAVVIGRMSSFLSSSTTCGSFLRSFIHPTEMIRIFGQKCITSATHCVITQSIKHVITYEGQGNLKRHTLSCTLSRVFGSATEKQIRMTCASG